MFKVSYDATSNTLTLAGHTLMVWIDRIPESLRREAEFFDRSLISEDTVQNIIYEFSERGAVITQINPDSNSLLNP